MKGYYKMPEATSKLMDHEGWFHTGDMATIDENGYIRITGRLSDVFMPGGLNVSPEDVENEVKKRIADLAPGGGYVLAAVHNIQAGVRPENICMMYESARKYGIYPINF